MNRRPRPYHGARTRAPAAVLATLAAAALALAGCGSGGGTGSGPATGAPATAAFPATAGGVTLAHRPTRIVSLAPTATEMLYAVGAGTQVVAVDDQSTYPSQAPRTDLSGFKPNAEAVAAKNPDLVVISNDLDTIKAQLTQLKIPVLLLPAASTLDDMYQELTTVGTLTGHTAEASAENGRIRADIAKLVAGVATRTRPLTYYYELDPNLYTVTSKTFVGSVFALLGLTNIADPADAGGKAGGYPQLSAEAVVKANPDLVFLADVTCCQQSLATVSARAGWAAVAAVRDHRVFTLDDDIASRWGPRVVDLLRAITDALATVPTS